MATGEKDDSKWVSGRLSSSQHSWPWSSEHQSQMWGKLPPPYSPVKREDVMMMMMMMCVYVWMEKEEGEGLLAQGCFMLSAPHQLTCFCYPST